MKPFDLDAALRGEKALLRNGATARVVHYNPDAAHEESNLLGYDAGEVLHAWTTLGRCCETTESRYDIIGMAPVKQTRTGWINVYPEVCCDCLHATREAADGGASENRIACVPVTYEFEA